MEIERLLEVLEDCNYRLQRGYRERLPEQGDLQALWRYRKSLFEKYTTQFRDYVAMAIKEKAKEE